MSAGTVRRDLPGAAAWRRELLAQLQAKRASSLAASDRTVIRAEVPADGLEPLPWLVAQRPMSRGYWSDRDGGYELAGVGRAEVLTAASADDYGSLMDAVHRRLDETEAPLRYLGGMAFDPERPRAPEWEGFQAYRFILPRLEVVRQDGQTRLACNALAGEPLAGVAQELDGLCWATRCGVPIPAATGRTDLPGRPAWADHVNEVLGAVAEGRLEKVVLARRSHYRFDEAPDPAALLAALKASTISSYHFCFQPRAGHAFIGASPERLYRRQGRQLWTEALAGTRPRGEDPAADAALAGDLLADAKERREHAIVTAAVRAALGPGTAQLEADPEPSVLKLSLAQHLVTRFRGLLHEGVRDAEVLVALHPTPAVGGTPREAAPAWIRRLEPFDRGWYTGPVGWVSRDTTEFAVAIRSALVCGSDVYVYAGAGLVEGSLADREWDEIDGKASNVARLFSAGGEGDRT